MPRLPAARGRLNHDPGFHLSCDEHLSKGWGPPLGRGGPRNSDSLLRWDPDQGEGVWHATEATELSC